MATSKEDADNKLASCDPDGMCCHCIDIKTGVVIIAVLAVVSGALFILNGLQGMAHNILTLIIPICCALPSLLGDFYFLKYLMDDNQETRNGLPRACLLQILTLLCNYIWLILAALFYTTKDAGIAGQVLYVLIFGGVGSFIGCAMWYYWMIVMKKHAGNL